MFIARLRCFPRRVALDFKQDINDAVSYFIDFIIITYLIPTSFFSKATINVVTVWVNYE